MLMMQTVTVLSPRAKSSLERLVLDLLKVTKDAITALVKARWAGSSRHRHDHSLQAVTLAPSGGVVAGLSISEGLGVALPCASAKRSCLLPEVLNDRSSVGRRPPS